jgi:two-component system, NarL family, sensor histidine kinase UhpB
MLCGVVNAQSYTVKDSTEIYKWLDLADNQSHAGAYDDAMKSAEAALELSRRKKMQRGEGFAKLKMADVMAQQSVSKTVYDLTHEAMQIGADLKDSLIIALGWMQMGQYNRDSEKYEESEAAFKKALAIKFEKDQSFYTALLYNEMGYMFGEMEESEKQVDCYLKAVRVYEKIDNEEGLAQTLNNIGTVYGTLGDKEKALDYVRRSVVIREKNKDYMGLSYSYGNMSRITRSISIDTAIKYQALATQAAEKTGVKKMIMGGYDNMSVLMDLQRKKPEALEYIQKSIALSRELGDKSAIADKLRWAALLAGDIKDTVLMKSYFQESLTIASELKSKRLLRDFYATRSGAYRKVEDYRNAYEDLRKYYSYKDSIAIEATQVSIAELQTKYDTEKKDNEIARLNTSQRIKQLEIDKQKAQLEGNRLQAKQKEDEIRLLSQQQELRDIHIRQQEEELEKQKLLATNASQQLQLAEKETQIQEKQLQNQRLVRNVLIGGFIALALLGFFLFNRYQLKKKLEQQGVMLEMRNNISRNLHDDIGASLSNINILNELTKRNVGNPEKANSYLQKAGDDIQRISESLSDIVWNINPQYDDMDNLYVRMKRYAADMLDGKNIQGQLNFPQESEKLSMPMDQRRDFYLIFKEAVNNLVKYSKATEATVEVKTDDHTVRLVVSDNGKGFDKETVRQGNGIQNMKQRAAKWNGQLVVTAASGKGVRIELIMKIDA